MTDLNVRDYNGVSIPAAGVYDIDPNHARVGFAARHLVVSKVRGQFKTVTGAVTIAEDPLESSVSADIEAASIDTNAPDRDAHLRSGDFLEAEKYPQLTFRSTGLAEISGNEFKLHGDLTIKDVTRQVVLDVEFEGVNRSPYGQDVFGFSAKTEIDREEFGITWNVALETGGVMVGKKVTIEIEAEAIRRA